MQTLTKKMLAHNKYAFVLFPKSVLMTLSDPGNSETPIKFIEDIRKSFSIKDSAYMKAVSSSFVSYSEKEEEVNPSMFDSDSIYFNSSTLEGYFQSNQSAFKSFTEFYLKNNPFITVSFNENKHITKVLGIPAAHINVSHNNFHEKLDDICESIEKVKHMGDTVVLDCPVLSSGLAHKIWENFNLSILDFGKIIGFSKAKSLDRDKLNAKKTH